MHDVIILGAGPAGLSAALWCDQLGLDTLVLEKNVEIGGQLLSVYNPIDNYPGLRAATGREFLGHLSERLDKADFDLWTGADIISVNLKAKQISLSSGEELQSIALILATGVRRRQLGIPGEKEFVGHGLIESAMRDRDSFAEKDVCVIGGGDAAVENALLLAEVCPTVTVVHRGKSLQARRDFAEQIRTNHRLTVFTESTVTRIIGKEEVEAVEIVRKEALKPFQMAVQGVLIRIGVEPNTDLFRQQLKVDEHGYALVNSEHETDIPNVFAIGDISNPRAPTISGAVGAGATAAKVVAARLNRG
ncbi:MAG TPA: FAD-dependent oxidoreductase [Pyrinomonadaceae bacterium]|nr:FAD-dependent oxidoreductase [Pyrinomonadaceae bacterium]